jgi:predicted acyl esterase
MPFAAPTKPDNHGRHVIRTGGRYDSRLVLPILKNSAK